MSHMPRFYEIFPYKLSASGNVMFDRKRFTFQTILVLFLCSTAIAITFLDANVVARQQSVALMLLYMARRLGFVITILLSYFPIIDMKFTARRLLYILSRTSHFDVSVKTVHSRWRAAIDRTFLLIMVAAVVVQEKGNHSAMKGHVKILSNFTMNLLVYITLSYYRRILVLIGDKFNSIDFNSDPTEISRRHAVLFKASKTVIKMYSVPVLGIMTVSWIYCCSNLMYILSNRKKYWSQFIVSSCYLIYYCFLVSVVVVGSCSSVMKAAKRVSNHMINVCLTSENPNTVKIFRYHSYLYGNLEFRPLGLVVLEHQLLTQYFSAVVSYVAISLDYLEYIQN